jgi:hypothetical protein
MTPPSNLVTQPTDNSITGETMWVWWQTHQMRETMMFIVVVLAIIAILLTIRRRRQHSTSTSAQKTVP